MIVAGFLFLLATTHVLSRTNEGIGNSQVRCIERERQALLNFKQGLDDQFNILASWTSSRKDCCTWRGIRCDNLTNHIIMLDLRPNFTHEHDGFTWFPMGGKIGPSLLELQYLEHLDLSYNDFTIIPKFLGALTRLTYLNLRFNPFVGTIPSHLGNLTNLGFLDLTNYSGTMAVDNFKWLSHLPSLRVFRLWNTNFTKSTDWFQTLKSAPSLSTLELSHCQFPRLDTWSLSQANSSNSLTALYVHQNTIHPSTVPWFLNLSINLADLTLEDNFVGGPLPDSFENMNSLTHIQLPGNRFEGVIPKSLGNLCNLKELVLCRNNLDGTLRGLLENLGGCAKISLENLDLSFNKLNGSFPDMETFPISMRALNVSNNKLNGTLPESIADLSNLEVLVVSMNSFSGVISKAHLSKLSKLQHLDLSSNSLTVKFPKNWIPPFQLQYINLGSCILGSQFPSWLRTQSNIGFLNLSSSGISEAIPNWFSNILTSELYYLDLSSNLINGNLPNIPLNSTYFPFIDLSCNQFHGSVPPSLFSASILNLSNNTVEGFGSFFCAGLVGATQILDLSNNRLLGSLPKCWLQLNNLRLFNLEKNNLSGEIPGSMASLYRIDTLILRHNNFSGKLPSFLMNCTLLKLLDVGGNQLEGTIPTWIGERLTYLLFLILRSNKFHGMIPSSLCDLDSIRILDLSQNYINGIIPSCINKFTTMAEKEELVAPISVYYTYGNDLHPRFYSNKVLVRWKGMEYEYEKILGLLRIIDLSSNRLTGEIPVEMTNLVGLYQLNLSRNNLSGAIPENIGNLSQLESLDLSRNNLSGEISKGLAKVYTLDYLDLSYNHLSGRIPTSTQLQSFDAASYVGNLGLCGSPLSPTCPGDGTVQDRDPDSGDEENSFGNDHEWFYIGLEVGFALGFIGVCGALFLNSYWGLAYFRCVNNLGDWLYVRFSIRTSRLRRFLHD